MNISIKKGVSKVKIIEGKKYKNIHNGKISKVVDKIFFNIQYVEEGRENFAPSYTHYKTFIKNWVPIEIGDGLSVEGGLRGFVNYLNKGGKK